MKPNEGDFMDAIVWPTRIDIHGASLPKNSWDLLLVELKAEHVPPLTPTGKRLSVVVGPTGRVDAFIYRTKPMTDDEVLAVLNRHGIFAAIGSESSASK
jgi:hypothetical protein